MTPNAGNEGETDLLDLRRTRYTVKDRSLKQHRSLKKSLNHYLKRDRSIIMRMADSQKFQEISRHEETLFN